jgi:hypothetical protein
LIAALRIRLWVNSEPAGRHRRELEIGQAQDLLDRYGGARLSRPNGEKGQLGPHVLSKDCLEYLEERRFTAVTYLEDFLDGVIAQGYEFRQDFPADVVLVDEGRRTAGVQGHYTPRTAHA